MAEPVIESGLREGELELPDTTLSLLIRRYTREAGVRELERTLGRLSRQVALRLPDGPARLRPVGEDRDRAPAAGGPHCGHGPDP